jgi:hypothetical protein
MAIALGVDGIAIMLGTAITIKRERKSLAQLVADWIRQRKNDWQHITGVIGENPSPGTDGNAPGELREAVEIVTLKLRGKGSQFLREFYNAIDMKEPHIINDQVLNKHTNQTFKDGFRFLVDKLRKPGRAWVKMSEDKWVVASEHYHKLTEWLTEEIKHHTEEEANSGLPDDWGLSDPPETDVKFTIPPN